MDKYSWNGHERRPSGLAGCKGARRGIAESWHARSSVVGASHIHLLAAIKRRLLTIDFRGLDFQGLTLFVTSTRLRRDRQLRSTLGSLVGIPHARVQRIALVLEPRDSGVMLAMKCTGALKPFVMQTLGLVACSSGLLATLCQCN